MLLPYCLHCSLCQQDFDSKAEWNCHLVSGRHQALARRNWDSSAINQLPTKQYSVVIYSSFRVTPASQGALKVVQKFSVGVGNHVSGFWSWAERPFLAILQFESRNRARKVVGCSSEGIPVVFIDGQRVQMKLASELWDLEWKAVLPPMNTTNESQVPPIDLNGANEFLRTKRPLPAEVPPEERSQNVNYEYQQAPAKKSRMDINKRPVVPELVQRVPNSCAPAPDLQSNSSQHWASVPPDSIQHQFWQVYQSVALDETTRTQLLHLCNSLRGLLRVTRPQAEVVLIPDCHFSLSSADGTAKAPILFFAYNKTTCSPGFSVIGHESIRNTISCSKKYSHAGTSKKVPVVQTREGVAYQYQYIPTNTYFAIVTNPLYLVEAKTSQLLEYMCSFDARCHVLISMALYWFKSTELNSGSAKVSDPKMTMEWLVIHCLCHKKLIPTVRQIQKRPHQGPEVRENYKGVDIGFEADPEFARMWKRSKPEIPAQGSTEFVLSVLSLFHSFLEFYGDTLGEEKWILNTRDGESIPVDQLHSLEPGSTQMTTTDITALQLLDRNATGRARPNGMNLPAACKNFQKVNFKEQRWHVVHPLIFTWSLSLSPELPRLLTLMIETGQRLGKYLKMAKDRGIPVAEEEFGTLKQMLTAGQDQTSSLDNTVTTRGAISASAFGTQVSSDLSTYHFGFALKPEYWTNCPQNSIQHQFWQLYQSVALSNDLYEKYQDFAKTLKTLLRSKDPQAEVLLFRDFHLGFQPGIKNAPLLFHYSSGCKKSNKNISKTLRSLFSLKQVPNWSSSIGNGYHCERTGITFLLLAQPHLLVEAQVCRLLEYMCSFDIRCHALIALALHWTKEAGLNFGTTTYYYSQKQPSMPEPLTLEWLVVHFLCHKGILPTVRQIQQRDQLKPKVRKIYKGIDIGFESDPDFAREWKQSKTGEVGLPENADHGSEEFVLSVLALFHQFLEFYSATLGKGKWILNTRDGENVSFDKFCDSQNEFQGQTQMTSADLTALKLLLNTDSKSTGQTMALPEIYKDISPVKLNKSGRRWHMVHPFIFTWNFAFLSGLPTKLLLMQQTCHRLGKYLEVVKDQGSKVANKEFGTLKRLLTVETNNSVGNVGSKMTPNQRRTKAKKLNRKMSRK